MPQIKIIKLFLAILFFLASFSLSHAKNCEIITSVHIKSLETTNLENLPVTVAQVFKKGDLTEQISAIVDEKNLPTQTTVLSKYKDGSIRQALISFQLPEIAANAEKEIFFCQTTEKQTGDAISIQHILNTEFKTDVTFTFPSGKTETVSLQDVLQNNVRTRFEGPIVSEFIAQKTLEVEPNQELEIIFVVRKYTADDRIRLSVIVENTAVWFDQTGTKRGYDLEDQIINGDIDYDFQITINDAVWYEKTGLTHYFRSRFRKLYSELPKIQIKPNIPYLLSTKTIPNYTLRLSPEELNLTEDVISQRYQDWQNSAHDVLEVGIIEPYMPETGGRGDIGPYPWWATAYIFTQDWRLEEMLINLGELGGSFSVHDRHPNKQRIFSIADAPEVTYMSGAWGHQSLKKTAATPYSPDSAHQPSLAFIPYLITGDYYFLEEMFFWANFNVIQMDPDYRAQEKGLLSKRQIRGQAWALRNIADAAAFAPEDSFEKIYLEQIIQNNIDYYRTWLIGPPADNNLGWIGKQSNLATDGGRPDAKMSEDVRYYTSPWMSDFLVWTFGHLDELGYDAGEDVKEWLMNFTIGRFTASGFNPQGGATYHLATYKQNASGSAVQIQTWQEMYEATYANQEPDLANSSYAQIAQGALVNGVDSGAAKALAAYNFLKANPAAYHEIMWEFEPRENVEADNEVVNIQDPASDETQEEENLGSDEAQDSNVNEDSSKNNVILCPNDMRQDKKYFVDLFEEAPWTENVDNGFQTLVQNNIIEGEYSQDGNGQKKWFFTPNQEITRAEFLKLTIKAFAYYKQTDLEYSDNLNLPDVSKNTWFYPYYAFAYDQGIIEKGLPNEPINRAEVSKILVKLFNLQLAGESLPNIPDVNESDWFYSPVTILFGRGIVSGYQDGLFHPERNITRAQVAKILTGFLQK